MERYENIQAHVLQHRRHLHRIPEVGSILPETSAYIQSQLYALGIPFQKSAIDSSIVAIIEGCGDGRCIAFRADMDALPVQEETGLPFCSQHPGAMHACGHDAHAAMLLGAAEILTQRRGEFRGTVKLLFQANEELCLGAKQMIADGALHDPDVDALVSLHIGCMDPNLELGQIGIYPGTVMASSDRFDLYVHGKSGHCSRPEQTIDAISIASQVINTLQTVISRETDTLEPRVLSFCSIEGGSTYNVIPDTVRIRGSIRAMSTETRDFMVERVTDISKNVAKAMRAQVEVDMVKTTPVLSNDPGLSAVISKAARTFLPDGLVKTHQEFPLTGSEDAAYFHELVPAVYCFLCSSNPGKHTNIPHHNSRFDIDEDVLWEGSALFAASALQFLNSSYSESQEG